MSGPVTGRDRGRRAGRRLAACVASFALAATLGACGDGESRPAATGEVQLASAHGGGGKPAGDVATAMRANAAYQDVEVAEAAGYASTLDDLGCFVDAEKGGMGVHYLDESLLDEALDVATPEALVYELDGTGQVAGLVAHEYIVPVDAWTSKQPPRIFGVNLHRHPTLPLWVLHAWLWKDNPTGMHADWNPAVRPCPKGVPVFGVDRPR